MQRPAIPIAHKPTSAAVPRRSNARWPRHATCRASVVALRHGTIHIRKNSLPNVTVRRRNPSSELLKGSSAWDVQSIVPPGRFAAGVLVLVVRVFSIGRIMRAWPATSGGSTVGAEETSRLPGGSATRPLQSKRNSPPEKLLRTILDKTNPVYHISRGPTDLSVAGSGRRASLVSPTK